MGQVLEMNTTLRHLLFLLEYCMVTGYDWWDVLLHVQPTMVHNLVEKLHEEYMRQNQALQQVSDETTLPMMPQCSCPSHSRVLCVSGPGNSYCGSEGITL